MRRATCVALPATLAVAALATGCGDDKKGTTIKEGTAVPTVTQTVTVQTQATTGASTTGGQAAVARSDAEQSARREASSQLENQPGGFTVRAQDWQVNCSGGESGGPWTCRLNSGPCSGTAQVTPRPDGLSVTTAKVGCIAD